MKKLLTVSISLIGVGAFGFVWYRNKVSKKNKVHKIEIKIHNTVVGNVIGRYGETIKNIQSKCNVKIKFVAPDLSSDYTACTIKGDVENVKRAANIINCMIKNYNDDSVENLVLFNNENEFEVSQFDSYSKQLLYSIPNTTEIHDLSQENYYKSPEKHVQKLYSTSGDGLIPVYVSAVASPEQFWVQAIKTHEHIELDRLTVELAEFYESNPQFNVPPDISDVKPGFICALYFDLDNRWYRVEVSEVAEYNTENVFDTTVDLYFLDYGESFYKTIKDLRTISPKFLTLNYQAIQCSLANLKSANGTWSEEAVVFFEEITHVAQWYTLMARVDSDSSKNFPLLTLIDTNSEMDKNIGDELVKNGYAQYIE